LEGIPVTSAISSLSKETLECYHSDCDDFSHIRPAFLEGSALVHTLLAIELGNSGKLPFKKMKDGKLSKWLEAHGLKEKLQISGEWKYK
jgi:hypothetical protein